MTPDNFCFYLQNRLIQTSQTGGQWCSDTSPFNIPCIGFPGPSALADLAPTSRRREKSLITSTRVQNEELAFNDQTEVGIFDSPTLKFDTFQSCRSIWSTKRTRCFDINLFSPVTDIGLNKLELYFVSCKSFRDSLLFVNLWPES
jgi:hypothetical protein